MNGRTNLLSQHFEMRGERRHRARHVSWKATKRRGLEQVDIHELPQCEVRRQPRFKRRVPRFDGVEKAWQTAEASMRIANLFPRHQQRSHGRVELEGIDDGKWKVTHDVSHS